MQTSKEAREARRKRILERGSDRLAYITGDASKQRSLKACPISPPQETSSIATLQDGYRSRFDSPDAKPEGLELSGHVTESLEDSRESASDGQSSYSAEISAAPSEGSPLLLSSSRSFAEPSNAVPVLALTSRDNTSYRRPLGVKANNKSSLTYVKNIVFSIEASESLRALAAVIVAVFVVLQTILLCCGHPWGNALTVVLPGWPIGLVFLTDLTLVIGTYIIHSPSKSVQKDLGSKGNEGLDGSLDKISQALDVVGRFEDLFNIGLLCKKAACAISLDCSIYVVTIVCGFSLSQYAFSCCKDF